MTPHQRKMARHALGLPNKQKRSYRNHYAAPLGEGPEVEWNDLVSKGLAERGSARISIVVFCLTESGALLALDAGERLDPEDFPAVSKG